MTTEDTAYALGKEFHAALTRLDWDAIRSLLHADATWTLPGENTISGTAVGADAAVERAKKIAGIETYLSDVPGMNAFFA